jgi:hypothetical protein
MSRNAYDSIPKVTLDAGAYLMRHAPERLQAWLNSHNDPRWLEKQIREYVADERKKRSKLRLNKTEGS